MSAVRRYRGVLLAVALVALAGVGQAQQQPPATAPSAAPAPVIEPEAVAALERMGAFLRGLRAFELRAATTTDEVLDTGQKIQFDGLVRIRVRKPNGVRSEVSNDRKERQFFYDGKTLTLYAPRVQYYASVPAPPTIRETIELLAQRYDVELPLADLFLWGTDQARLEDIKAAISVGPARVEGAECDQYAFRQDEVDWQIWIQKGKSPLPKKLVITTKTDDAQPQYVAVLRWNLAPKFDDKTFSFVPPKGAQRITLRAVGAQPGGTSQ